MSADAIAKLRLLVLAWRERANVLDKKASYDDYCRGRCDGVDDSADELEAIIAEHVQ